MADKFQPPKDDTTAIWQTMVSVVLPMLEKHEADLHGTSQESGLKKQVADIQKIIYVCTGVIIAVEFALKYLK